jgi:nitrous oxide reductase accessory protein NosL
LLTWRFSVSTVLFPTTLLPEKKQEDKEITIKDMPVTSNGFIAVWF